MEMNISNVYVIKSFWSPKPNITKYDYMFVSLKAYTL